MNARPSGSTDGVTAYRPDALIPDASARVAASPSTWRKDTSANGTGATTSKRPSAVIRSREFAGEPHVLPDVVLDPLGAAGPEDEHQLERAEEPAERARASLGSPQPVPTPGLRPLSTAGGGEDGIRVW